MYSSEREQQALGAIGAKPTDLHQPVSNPITSQPLIIASLDSSLYKSEKADFRNYIMKSSNSVSSSFPRLKIGSLMR